MHSQEEAPRFSAETSPSKKNWFSRNWYWLVPLLIALPVLMCGGMITGVFALVSGILKNSDPYQTALERASHSPAVIARLGEPIKDDTWIPMGNLDYNGGSGNADLLFHLRGPQGTATVHTVSTLTGQKWEPERLMVTFADGEEHSLLD